MLKTGHGPHLLRDFYHDFRQSQAEIAALDNGPEDRDPRPDRVDLGSEQAILGADSLAIRQQEGRSEILVWLDAHQVGERFTMVQDGWAADPQGWYRYPLALEGPGDMPFDPPDAVRVGQAEYAGAWERYQAQWNLA